ncbi:uncharacterized protein LOC133312909 isoform X2 [Gastrolobium bilobum]|uniref:uncharacterized protein LOC133312909 isoform X2 n=1 Tax=Gastrolobium bilobum TaxID=150636 RepID=UPI002AAFE6DB|nr:uncharacterized protein LOC133312909 isoform X2 [Gastrolobium bilobum]
MLRATAFPAPFNSVPVLTRAHTCHSLAPARVVHSRSSFVSLFGFQQFRQPYVNLRTVRGGRFVAAAAKKQRRRDGAGSVRMDEEEDDDIGDTGNEYDEEDEEEDEEGEDDDDDDEEIMLPLEQMKKWYMEKPLGFGEGKVYDTSIEDKLLEEMRKSIEAQAANLKKLKSNPLKPASNKKVVPIGVRVRLVNLPRKKNIHRDLKSALQGIPGIMNIVPAVTGNKKTRDPICKGFAFVDFKHEKDAVRFVELYTGQTLTFGKIQKQIKCELVNVPSSSSSPELSKNVNAATRLMVSAFEEDSNEDSNMDESALISWDGTNSDDSDDDMDNQIYGEEQEGDEENEMAFAALKMDSDDSMEMSIDSEINSLPSEQVNGNPTAEQKSSAKDKQENSLKKKQTSKKKAKKVLDVPGSAKRLKIKEKAVLSDVFSKYGLKAALASKDS